jgi:cyclophilin family peptidyl-prolyl cis-trans isomerase/protein-disulfide isomerase
VKGFALQTLLAVGLALAVAACGSGVTTELPTPPPVATLTRVPTVPVSTPTALLLPTAVVTAGPSPSGPSLFAPVTEADWQSGAADAPATIIAYSDFQCEYCATLAPMLARLRDENPNDLRLVFRHYPLPQHDKAMLAAIAAEAAGYQGKFWEMHDVLFARQTAWTALTEAQFQVLVRNYAQELGLEPEQFARDLASEETEQRVLAARAAATAIPLPGAPFVLFNGAPIQDERMLNHWALTTLVRLERLKEKQYSSPPPDVINPFAAYTATIKTVKGDIVIQLFAERTPLTVNNFVFLAREGWYDNVTFHRMIPGFAAQTGDPSGTGYGGPGYFIPDEIVPDLQFNAAGWVGMANSGRDTNGSQFFITLGPTPELDGKYTLFGQVISGLNVVQSLTPRDPNENSEAPPGDLVHTILIEEQE